MSLYSDRSIPVSVLNELDQKNLHIFQSKSKGLGVKPKISIPKGNSNESKISCIPQETC